MKVRVPYGEKDAFNIEIADNQLVGVYNPNPVTKPDADQVISEALAHPIDSPSFDEFINTDKKIVFIVNDGTRPTPTAKILKLIYPKIKDKNISFIVATGVHRAPTEAEYRFIFGSDIYEDLKARGLIHSHDSKNDPMDYLGKSKNGTEMYINKIVAEADRVVPISSIEPLLCGIHRRPEIISAWCRLVQDNFGKSSPGPNGFCPGNEFKRQSGS